MQQQQALLSPCARQCPTQNNVTQAGGARASSHEGTTDIAMPRLVSYTVGWQSQALCHSVHRQNLPCSGCKVDLSSGRSSHCQSTLS